MKITPPRARRRSPGRGPRFLVLVGVALLALECFWLLPDAVRQHTTWEIIMDSVTSGIQLMTIPINWINWQSAKDEARIERKEQMLRVFLEEVAGGQVADARPEG